MKIPKYLYTCGLTWRVRKRANLKHEGERADGVCVHERQEILLRTEITDKPDRVRTTLLHEFWHAALRQTPQYYDENLIATLEIRTDELLRENPELVELYGYVSE